MKSSAQKLHKRPRTGKESDEHDDVPRKKKNRGKLEKENNMLEFKNSAAPKLRSKKENKILKDSFFPINKVYVKKVEHESSLSSETDEDDDLHDMFLQLKKNGFKINTTSSTVQNTLPDSKTNKSIFQQNVKLESDTKSSNHKKSTKIVHDKSEMRDDDSIKFKDEDINPESSKKVLELEKSPQSLILNYKRTPRRVSRLQYEKTSEKAKSNNVQTPKRSSRRLTVSEEEFTVYEGEATSIKKSSSTPKKSSSVKKKGVTTSKTSKTPKNIIEEKLPATPLEKARLSLHLSAVPDNLPCREKEYNNILSFLKNKLWDGIGGCMYISGVPGTGKTATVTQVIKHLQEEAQSGRISNFKYIEINGMRLADPRQAYVQLWQNLFDKSDKVSPDHAQKLLDDWFGKCDKKNEKISTVLLVDELDLICTKKQDVVYNLLDWPTRTHSRLVVLTIANTMDMPERFFKGRITSRMGLTRLTFMPYTFKQLEEIVLNRLNGLDAFVSDAVQLVTRKVAAVSGDARRALDICRRAAELPAFDERVKISHIEQAIKEMTNSNIVKIIRNCSKMEKIFLRSLCDVSFLSNVEEVDLIKVMDQFLTICVLEGMTRPTASAILCVLNRLKCSRLIFGNQSSPGIVQRIMLNVTQDDIHYALQA